MNAQPKPLPIVPAASTASAPKKLAESAKECKRKGGDFSPGATFCVFSGLALLCENGVWKHQDLPACIVTPAVLPCARESMGVKNFDKSVRCR
jgi:hypothetical protein